MPLQGCTRDRRLHAHHVRFWQNGGTTDAGNPVLICSHHHTVLPQHGFSVALAPDRSLTVTSADGITVLHHTTPPWGDRDLLDPDQDFSAAAATPEALPARRNLGYCVALLLQQAA